jgi:hypothetical protein
VGHNAKFRHIIAILLLVLCGACTRTSPKIAELEPKISGPTFGGTAVDRYEFNSDSDSYQITGVCDVRITSLFLSLDGSTWSLPEFANQDVSCADGTFSLTIPNLGEFLELTIGSPTTKSLYLRGATKAGATSTSTFTFVYNPPTGSLPTALLTGLPTDPSSASQLAVVVAGANVAQYRFKVGPSTSTTCSDSTGYSTDTPVATGISTDISSFADGVILLCVIGKNDAGVYQSYAQATRASWTKDSSVPGAFTIGGIKGGTDVLADAWLTDSSTPLVVTATWSASTGATSYTLVIRDAADTTDVCTGTAGSNADFTFTSCSLSQMTTYKLKITASNGSGLVPATNSNFSFTVDSTATP